MIPQHKITLCAVCGYSHWTLNHSELSRLFIYTWYLINNLLNFWKVFDFIVIVPVVFLKPWIKFVEVLFLCVSETLLIFIEDLVIVCLNKPKIRVV
ncbi:hypothetical protein OtV2_187 [Ostreococcus tauri virus 2]|uniref:hypothetical protein n=1 Tax=Ostreococcus tauri virus 2 TaxID=696472 RepID=UPI0001EF4691|nr:hypothetical protein OtV2_187 [Ostreococcus tauri virus 2]CBI70186.1 hypothetical protein OtV2_187 [Ostreococcus tauri virus 2]